MKMLSLLLVLGVAVWLLSRLPRRRAGEQSIPPTGGAPFSDGAQSGGDFTHHS